MNTTLGRVLSGGVADAAAKTSSNIVERNLFGEMIETTTEG